MKTTLLKSMAAALLTLTTAVCASAGPGSGGGGDQFTADYIRTANEDVYMWLKDHGSELSPAVNAEVFRSSIDATKLASKDVVFESCDGSTNGRIVAACFNAQTQMIYLSRRLYPLDLKNSPSKISLVMHEQFRKMGLEGDQYEVTRSIWAERVMSETMQSCIVNMVHAAGMYSSTATDFCQRNGADAEIQQCTINYKFGAQMYSDSAGELCERTRANIAMQKCVVNLVKNADMYSSTAIETCEGHKETPVPPRTEMPSATQKAHLVDALNPGVEGVCKDGLCIVKVCKDHACRTSSMKQAKFQKIQAQSLNWK